MPKKQAVAEPKKVEAAAVIARVLPFEDQLRAAADDYPSGDNSDAVKAALRSAARGVGHIRKVLDTNARLGTAVTRFGVIEIRDVAGETVRVP